ncbi:MAG: hypothetical protein IPO31_24495 [Candidatus Obscuribacter sp.]|jgi:hypothetical protein|nr:hypothetical protein [Candidatus Obscuribacter sp.]
MTTRHQTENTATAGDKVATSRNDAGSDRLDSIRQDAYNTSFKGDASANRDKSESLSFVDMGDVRDLYKSGQDKSPNEKSKLESYIASHPQDAGSMKDDLNAFADRMKGRPDGEKQMKEVLKSVNGLLDAGDDAALKPAASRAKVAGEILHHSAHPGEVNQGAFNACSFATMQTEMYTRHPAQAARLVADAARTGEYTAADGTSVTLDERTLNHWSNKLPEALRGSEDKLPPRDHASQIFQAVAFNVKLDNGTDESPQYVLRRPDATSPSGEAVVTAEHPTTNMLFSKLPNNVDYLNTYKRISGEDSNGVLTILDASNGNQLKAHLQQLKNDGKLPLAVPVNALSKPVIDTVGEGNAAGAAVAGVGSHMITVSDIDAEGNVQFVNHLNGSKLEAVSSDEMYSYTTMRELDKETLGKVAQQAADGTNPATIERYNVDLALRMVNPGQRDQFLDMWETKVGKNLGDLLQPDDKKRLGVRHSWASGW